MAKQAAVDGAKRTEGEGSCRRISRRAPAFRSRVHYVPGTDRVIAGLLFLLGELEEMGIDRFTGRDTGCALRTDKRGPTEERGDDKDADRSVTNGM